MAANPRAARRRNEKAVAQRESQAAVVTPSDQFLASSMPLASAGCYARMGKGVAPLPRPSISGRNVALAAGNSVVTTDERGGSAASAFAKTRNTGGPGKWGNDTGVHNESPYGSVSGQQVRRVDTRPESLSSGFSYTDAFQHGRLIARDRHVIENQGRTTSSNQNQRTGANPNPEADGPPRPAWKMFNRSLSWQIGITSTRNLDNHQFHAAVMAGERKFPLGTQGDEWSRVYGGTRYLASYRPYGHRGGYSNLAPTPTVRADPGGPYRFGTLLAVGAPEDGPQKVYGGLPWGLHSPTVPPSQVLKSMLGNRFGQVKPVWNIRPSNSKVAGQSWSQSMVSLTGQQAVNLGSTPPIRQPGLNARWLGA